MADISQVKLPNGTTYDLKDNGALQLTGGQVTGPVTFGSAVSIDEGTIGDLVVNGNASFVNNISANTINGVAVGSSPKFTDTITTVTTSGSGNAVTAITASNGALTVTKGSTFLLTSDISSWAKASSKPSYTFSEIGSKPTTISGYGITDAYTKTEIDSKISAVLKYKGTKATVAALPSSGNTAGDVWHVTADGSEWAWDGSAWQELGTAIDLSGYAQLSGASFTGPVEFGDSVTMDDASINGLVVSGSAVFSNNIAANTINGVTVGSSPKFTDTVPTATQSATTGISIAAHGTGTVIGVQSSTTTASKVTIGSHSTDYGVKSAGSASTWTFEEKTIPNVTAAGSASTWTFEEKTIPNVTSAGTASSWTFEEKSIPNVTAAGSGSASLTFAMDTTDTKKLKITFSHTHTAPTIGTAIKVQSKSGGSNGTAPTLGTAIKVQSKSGGANGSAPTLGTAIKVQSKSGGANGSAPTLGSKVPTVSASDVTVPIKNASASTFVTGTTHTITDNGHTHAI